MKGDIVMSTRERRRLEVMSRVKKGELRLGDAGRILAVSYRQAKRIRKRYKEEGDIGLVHRSRGRRSNRAFGEAKRARILRRCQERYGDFGPTLAVEKLVLEGYELDHETLRRWLIASGQVGYPQRKGRKYRKKRKRREHFGEMVQMDGSLHDWLENGQQLCFMTMVDDATSTVYGQFDSGETTEVAMRGLYGWIEKYGIPAAIYSDYKSLFYTDREASSKEQLAGKKPRTQFGALCDRLGIQTLFASSPQAKGRVERMNGTLQNRLIKEMRLCQIKTLQKANDFVENYFPGFNQHFAKKPERPEDYHRNAPEDMDSYFYTAEERIVMSDWTLSYHTRTFQIAEKNRFRPNPKQRVSVCRYLDGTLHLLYKDHPLVFEELHERPQKVIMRKPFRPHSKPAPDHPWRQMNDQMFHKRKGYPQSQKSPSQISGRPPGSSSGAPADHPLDLTDSFSAHVDNLISRMKIIQS